ncbi:uncharacterized protein FAM163A isoform X1 [Pan troglodytes]|uniref:uncharacterized protein FAM163A isoform X1 n=1 Tax=Pan troglodytes TaxID=9598 RepID=UPI000D0A0C2A|nr:protein FAM163A isoform X1 [Pan troglodytes]
MKHSYSDRIVFLLSSSFSLLKLEAPEVGPHTSLCCLHRPVLSSLPPAQELLFYHWPGLKFEVLTGTDALGHDVPPTAVCSGVARVTESLLLQLFHSLMGRRADDSGNGCDHWRNPSYGDPPLHHCRPVLLQAPVLLLQEERNRGCRRGGGAGARPSHASQRPHLQCLQLPSPGRQRQPGASHQRALQPALWGGREPLHYLLPIQLPLLHTDG